MPTSWQYSAYTHPQGMPTFISSLNSMPARALTAGFDGCSVLPCSHLLHLSPGLLQTRAKDKALMQDTLGLEIIARIQDIMQQPKTGEPSLCCACLACSAINAHLPCTHPVACKPHATAHCMLNQLWEIRLEHFCALSKPRHMPQQGQLRCCCMQIWGVDQHWQGRCRGRCASSGGSGGAVQRRGSA